MKRIREKKERPRLRKTARTKKVTQRKLSSGPVCLLCLQEPGDPEKLGDFLQKNSLCVHYFCLILSSKLPQKGQPKKGLHGFMPEDIKKEAARASKKICFVCKQKGAAIKCQNEQCVKNFHLPCGQERGCLSQFFGEYKSFCGKHRPTQDIQQEGLEEESCVLCCEDLSRISVENIQSPCCNQAIYHRRCIQKYAHTSAKHFFKCPHCNNREEFPQEMLRMGIHIPDRRWRLILCATCGSHGTHRDCSSLRPNSKKWECNECSLASTMGK
uniref:PHD finger protein 7 n=1 Tax=Peromyscus maniculatus bairdii TaxID=230844 RepID=A0A8C8TXD0_PERMB